MTSEPASIRALAAAAPADPFLERLRAAWAVRLPPGDAVEEAALASLAAAQWRRARLDALECLVLDALVAGEVRESRPSLDTLARYAGRLAKDYDSARDRLLRLRTERRQFPQARPAGAGGAELGAGEPEAAAWRAAEPAPAGPIDPARWAPGEASLADGAADGSEAEAAASRVAAEAERDSAPVGAEGEGARRAVVDDAPAGPGEPPWHATPEPPLPTGERAESVAPRHATPEVPVAGLARGDAAPQHASAAGSRSGPAEPPRHAAPRPARPSATVDGIALGALESALLDILAGRPVPGGERLSLGLLASVSELALDPARRAA